MNKHELVENVDETHAAWDQVVDELGPQGLERPGANGEWRVRDVIAHFNSWERWQLVQLRCALTGEEPTDEELLGGIDYPPNDDLQEDAMNAMFMAGTRDLPTDDILRRRREVNAIRSRWLEGASQEQLDAVIGADGTGGSPRILRLESEVPTVSNKTTVAELLADQMAHQRQHLTTVRDWMTA